MGCGRVRCGGVFQAPRWSARPPCPLPFPCVEQAAIIALRPPESHHFHAHKHLHHHVPRRHPHPSLHRYTSVMYDTAPPASVHLVQMTTRLRGALTRVAVISHSTYLPAGYALVELFVLLAYIIGW